MQVCKKFPNERVNGKTKTASEICLVETDFISIRVTGNILVTWNPNSNRIKELKPIPDSLVIFLYEGTLDIPSLLRSRKGSNLRNHTIIRQG